MQLIDPLLQQFQLKNVTLRNRVVSTSHEPSYTEDGMPKRRYRLYHEEKAKGGIGLTMMGGSAVVAPDSPAAFGNLHVYKDEIVPWLRELAYGVHENGAAVMCQITHLGRRTSNYDGDWLPVIAPSAIREPAHRAFPKVAEEWDMDRIVKAYADATARCREAGLDGIELEAYTHLLDSFWSPLTNHRDDEYGMGSLEDRLRFPLRVIRAVREAAGPDFAVGIRMSLDEDIEGGLKYDDGLEIAKRVVAEGIDFISVIKGYMASDEALSRVIPPMGTPVAPHLEFAGQVKEALPNSGHARRAHQRRGDRAARDPRRVDRSGRYDPRAHRRPAHRRENPSGRGRPDPAVRRRELLPRRDLPGPRRQVRTQRVNRTRGPHAAPRASPRPDLRAKRSSSAAVLRASRRHGCSASAATRLSCSRRLTHRAARFAWPRRHHDVGT